MFPLPYPPPPAISYTYTERQKKLITSLECLPLKSKAWILFEHRLGKFVLNKHIEKQKFTSIIEEINAMKSQEVNFSKITETACLSGKLKLNE